MDIWVVGIGLQPKIFRGNEKACRDFYCHEYPDSIYFFAELVTV